MEKDLWQRFPIETMSPEEYAARYATDIMEFSYGRLRYSDPRLDDWIQRLQEVLTDWKLVNECREKYLTADELKRAIELDEEGF
jgi:hypothetical protein